MAIDTTSPRPRRAILLGVLGGAAATIAASVGRANPVSAADGQAVLVGGEYTASSVTKFDTQATGASALAGSSDYSTGVAGESVSGWGVSGLSSTGVAIKGSGQGGIGVYGDSASSYGIYGLSTATDQPATLGLSQGNSTGVQGCSGNGLPAAPTKTGVYGYAGQGASARGVTGQTIAGRGVNGVATTGTGVYGRSTSGEGVRGTSAGSNGTAGSSGSGIASGLYGENTGGGFGTYGRSNVGPSGSGVFGESTAGTGVAGATTTGVAMRATSSGTGLALIAQGRVQFSMSGLASVAVGKATRTIKPGSDLVAGSLVLCTLESGQSQLAIQRVIKNTVTKTFTVYLSAAVAAGHTAKVGWFVIG